MPIAEDPINEYPMGQRVRLFVDFTNKAGVPANPDVVILKYLEGDSDNAVLILQASLANPTVGRWEFEFNVPATAAKSGAWIYRFEGSSASASGVNAADEKRFEVPPSPFYV
jgi:hypothetical protein